jgi:hypothetical protein
MLRRQGNGAYDRTAERSDSVQEDEGKHLEDKDRVSYVQVGSIDSFKTRTY